MKQVLVGGVRNSPSTAAAEYNLILGGRDWSVEVNAKNVISTPGRLKRLFVELSVAPGAGTSYTFTLRVNGVGSALTVNIANLNTLGSDTVNEAPVLAGNYVSLECTPAGPPAAVDVFWSMMFEGDNPKESLLMGSSSAPDTVATEYAPVQGNLDYNPIEGDRIQYLPTSGTIKNLYILLKVAPGVGNSYTFTLRLNGVDTLLTVIVVGAATTANNLVNLVGVVAGDYISIKCVPAGGPAAAFAFVGMTFVADIDGESLILGGTWVNLDQNATEYMYLEPGYFPGWNANENLRRQLAQLCTLRKLYVYLTGSPGAGNSYTFYVRINVADSPLLVLISGAATWGRDITNTATPSDGDIVKIKVVPVSAPTVRDARWSLVCYIPPVRGNIVPLMIKLMSRGVI